MAVTEWEDDGEGGFRCETITPHEGTIPERDYTTTRFNTLRWDQWSKVWHVGQYFSLDLVKSGLTMHHCFVPKRITREDAQAAKQWASSQVRWLDHEKASKRR
jgi:hypothetical protein